MKVYQTVITLVGDNLDADLIWGTLARDELANDVRGYIYNEEDGLQLTFDLLVDDEEWENDFDTNLEAWTQANDVLMSLMFTVMPQVEEIGLDVTPQPHPGRALRDAEDADTGAERQNV